MDVPTITMTRDEAATHLEEYRTSMHRAADAEITTAAKALEHLAGGAKLLNLQAAFEHAGLDDEGFPEIAIARSDRQQVRCRKFRNGYRFSCQADIRLHDDDRHPGLNRFVQWPDQDVPTWAWEDRTRYALVPLVPPRVLRQRSQLRDHWTLWEVEEWFTSPRIAVPDRDPLLLRDLGAGGLFAIVGEWDLTELERAIMQGRRDA